MCPSLADRQVIPDERVDTAGLSRRPARPRRCANSLTSIREAVDRGGGDEEQLSVLQRPGVRWMPRTGTGGHLSPSVTNAGPRGAPSMRVPPLCGTPCRGRLPLSMAHVESGAEARAIEALQES